MRGYLATWGDVARWFIYCASGSGRKWNNIRRDLQHLGKCTQNGDDEGIIRIDQLPTSEQAALIRKAIGLSKRPAVETSPSLSTQPPGPACESLTLSDTLGPIPPAP